MHLRPVVATFSTAVSRAEVVVEARRLKGPVLTRAAVEAGAKDWTPHQDEDGVPQSSDGWHWTNTNTRGLVAALVAPFPVGLDAEWLHRPRIEPAVKRFDRDDAGELDRLGGRGPREVLRLWTAKEAVLKLTRAGIADLGRTALTDVLDGERLRLTSRDVECEVCLRQWNEHLVTVAYPVGESPSLELVALP